MPFAALKSSSLILLVWAALALPVQAQIPDTLLHTLPGGLPPLQTAAELGYSVAASSNYIAAGAPLDDTGETDSGVVKVFNAVSGALLYTLVNPSPGSNDRFGSAVAISGTRLCVGTPGNFAQATYGSVYIYDLSGASPTQPVLTIDNSFSQYSGFASVLALSGSMLCVGGGTGVNGGLAVVYDLSSATPTTPKAYLVSNNGVETLFGKAVAISGNTVVVGAPGYDWYADGYGTVFVYDVSGYNPLPQPMFALSRSSRAGFGTYGAVVGIDGTRLVVGDPGEDTGATNAGTVYVYDLSQGTYDTPVFTLHNPAPSADDQFGSALTLAGARLAVGACLDDTAAIDAGSAYVYDLASPTPTIPVSTLANPSPAAGDGFGWSLALSGMRLVAGAYLDDMGTVDAGTAYVFDLSGGTPAVPVFTLNDPSFQMGNQYGTDLAVSGTRFVVGAPYEDTGALNAGSAYIYDLAGSTPRVPVLALHNPTPGADDNFGGRVGISGTRVAVAARADDTGATNSGSVYVYDLGGASPAEPVLTISNPSPHAYDYFGWLSLSGRWLAVGVSSVDVAATDAGCVYVYDLDGASPSVPKLTLYKPAAAASDSFGSAVASSGSLLVVGATLDDTGASNAGSAYVYDLSSATPTVPIAVLNNPEPSPNDYFGNIVAIDSTRVIVGCYFDDTGATDAGSAYVYDLGSDTPTVPLAVLHNPNPAVRDYFGNAVAISGTKAIVGAEHGSVAGVARSGCAYVYDVAGALPSSPVATLSSPNPIMDGDFGHRVALDGSTLVIGAPYRNSAAFSTGEAYVFGPSDGDSDGLRDTWEISRFGTQYGHGPQEDDDHDGIVNLLEMAFGLNPLQPNSSSLTPTVLEDGFLTLTLTKQPGVNYEVQSAGTLLPSLPESFSTSSTTRLIDDATTLKVRDNIPMDSTASRFMRVLVNGVP